MQPYRNCRWCYGMGCLYCHEERRKDQETPKLLFSADPNDPEDMRQLGETFGRESLEHAFTKGDGMTEIKFKAALASLMKMMRKAKHEEPK